MSFGYIIGSPSVTNTSKGLISSCLVSSTESMLLPDQVLLFPVHAFGLLTKLFWHYRTDNYRLNLIELNGPVNWLSWFIGHVGELPEQPHFLCLLKTDIDGQNDKITRGELLCILEMQEKFYKVPYLKEHVVFPVRFTAMYKYSRDNTNVPQC